MKQYYKPGGRGGAGSVLMVDFVFLGKESVSWESIYM